MGILRIAKGNIHLTLNMENFVCIVKYTRVFYDA